VTFIVHLTKAHHALVMPLANSKKALGQIVFLIGSDSNYKAEAIEIMTTLALVISGLVSRFIINEAMKIREIELEDAHTQALRRLGAASEYRDNETGMHIMRMSNYAVAIAKSLGLPEKQTELLSIAAPMHDVGKIGIADIILLKPGKLTTEEFDAMKKHTQIGEGLLHGSDSLLEAAREIALSHHENWDGSGYPHGLKGDAIPVLAQICSIADVFDALTSIRPYKEAWPVQQAIDWITGEKDKKFAPAIVEAFQNALPSILRIRELYREEIINPIYKLNLPEVVYKDVRWVVWDESLSVCIDVIDEHHRYLFDLVNDLINVIANKRGAKELVRVFNALTQYALVHFKAEEQMMVQYGYDGINRQKKQHNEFHEKLKELNAELHENPCTATIDIITYLQEWLVAHIRYEDAQLRVLTAVSGHRTAVDSGCVRASF